MHDAIRAILDRAAKTPRLSAAEEMELIKNARYSVIARQGNIESLILDNSKQIYSLVKKFRRSLSEEDAFFYAIEISIEEILNGFDLSKAARLGTHLYWQLRHQLPMHSARHSGSLAVPRRWENSGRNFECHSVDELMDDPWVDFESDVNSSPFILKIEELLDSLSPEQRVAVDLRFWGCVSDKQAAIEMGVSTRTYQAFVRSAVERLKGLAIALQVGRPDSGDVIPVNNGEQLALAI